MSASPFDIAKHLLDKSKLEYDISEYNPWLTNLIFSQSIDTVFFAQAMNENNRLTKKMQRDFYLHALQKTNARTSWNKPDINTNVELISKFYDCNLRVAAAYLKLLSADDIEKIKMSKGGNSGRSK